MNRTYEFDHLFICTEVEAPEGDRLVAAGLLEGSANTHAGQGTANRRFFFHNAMVELLWVHAPEETQSDSICRTRLWERWRDRRAEACPFGICLRSVSQDSQAGQAIAFSSWAYSPPYLPPSISIAVGTNSDILTEPMLFQIPFGQRPDQASVEKAQPLKHPLGLREITRIEVVMPSTNPGFCNPISPELQAVVDTHQVKLRGGIDYGLELGFDGEKQGQQIDFRPELPLIFRW
jgi:hypothetical protein